MQVDRVVFGELFADQRGASHPAAVALAVALTVGMFTAGASVLEGGVSRKLGSIGAFIARVGFDGPGEAGPHGVDDGNARDDRSSSSGSAGDGRGATPSDGPRSRDPRGIEAGLLQRAAYRPGESDGYIIQAANRTGDGQTAVYQDVSPEHFEEMRKRLREAGFSVPPGNRGNISSDGYSFRYEYDGRGQLRVRIDESPWYAPNQAIWGAMDEKVDETNPSAI